LPCFNEVTFRWQREVISLPTALRLVRSANTQLYHAAIFPQSCLRYFFKLFECKERDQMYVVDKQHLKEVLTDVLSMTNMLIHTTSGSLVNHRKLRETKRSYLSYAHTATTSTMWLTLWRGIDYEPIICHHNAHIKGCRFTATQLYERKIR